MSKVPTKFPQTEPIALPAAWARINANCLTSFDNFVRTRIMRGFDDYAVLAAELGYIPAEQRALKFSGSPYASMSSADRKISFVAPKISTIIAPFLRSKDFATANCLNAIDELVMSARDVPDFTYGNAQKWINMSIKYYLILMALSLQISGTMSDIPSEDEKNMLRTAEYVDMQAFYEQTHCWNYDLFPIDTPMCKHVTADLGMLPAPVYTPYPWSKNMVRGNFEDYWNFVLHELPTHGWTDFKPCLYEMYVW